MQQNIAHDLDEKQRTKDVLLNENVTFTSLLLNSAIKNGLSESGFKKPSPIQFKAIPLGRCGFDLIVKSKSGTGKTLVFSTIALETVNVAKEHLQVLILVPTREIAVQIQDVLKSIGRCINGLCVESFIGGMPLEDDFKKCRQCHIAVGAPGRVKHLLKLGALSTDFVRLFVLDEADKLMETTFQNDINEIYDSLPQRKQFITASATYPKELDMFLANYMLSPTHVTSENETPLLLGLKQFVSVLKANTINPAQQMKAKNEILLEIFSKVSFTQCLVFTNYQSRTESVCNFLNQNGWNSAFISAAVDQSGRLEAINNLKNFKSRILLSTDLTSRGIDAPNVDLVINYDLPVDAVTYLHRMGRAGRYGSSGICINFALEGLEIKKMQLILGTIGATNLSISKLPPLNGTDLWQLDPNKLEQIWGVATSDDASEGIKNEIMSLKQQKKSNKNIRNNKKIKLEEGRENVAKNKSSRNHKKKIKLEELVKGECVEDALKDKEEEMDNLEYSVDAESLLHSLINYDENSNDDDNKKRKRGSQEKIKLEDLTKSDGVNTLLKDNRKDPDNYTTHDGLKSDDLLTSLITGNSENQNLELPIDSKKDIFSKNKALLTIAKLLSDCSVNVDEDITDSIDRYLKVLKENHLEDTTAETVEEILGAKTEELDLKPALDTLGSLSIKSEELDLEEDKQCLIEDIFKIGYECALKNEDRTWLNCLPDEEVQHFQEFCRLEQVVVSSESEEEDEDFGMEEVAEDDVANPDGALQWVPIVQDEAEINSGHFEQCYDECSNVLWQTGLTFETVSDFDDFFYSWQEQLQSVRNYIQQNIYVQEMSKYQQSRH